MTKIKEKRCSASVDETVVIGTGDQVTCKRANSASFPSMSSRLVTGRRPPPGQSSVADAIRSRRGERGLTPLDVVLLHSPPIAEGWNSLLGAVRTKGALPGDVRELMVCLVLHSDR